MDVRVFNAAMKLKTIVASLALGAIAGLPLAAQAQSQWAGTWVGELKAGAVSLRLVFNVAAANGALTATMDSPDQGAKGIPVSKVGTEGATITMEVAVIGGSYTGTLSADGASIDGTWSQGGQKFPIVLKKQAGAFVLERPQEPKPPFPYAARDVSFKGGAAGVTLAGTLTIPAGKGPFPAVVLVSGSGLQNRDEEIMGHKPFAVIADFLSRSGIVVLRYDDRGAAQSKGDPTTATTFDFADDAEAAFTYLAAQPEVNPRRVGIMGHSEGGLIAPIIASRNARVGFIVLLAGTGVNGEEVLLSQQKAILVASGIDEKTAADGEAVNRKAYAVLFGGGDADANAAAAKKIFSDAIDAEPGLTDQQRAEGKAGIDQAIAQLRSPWMKTFVAADPAPYLKKVRVPVLALNGTKDLQVLVDLNLPAIESALKAGGNTKYKTVRLDGLNHLFQHAGTGLPEEYGKITETFAPEALTMIRDWILALK